MVKVITDNGSDLTIEEGELYDIDVLPLTVREGSVEYVLEEDISLDHLYKNMKEGSIYTTSQVNAGRYLEVFEKYAKQGVDVLYISLSSSLSGTYSTAKIFAQQIKKEYPNSNIYVYDSLSATCGQRIMALKAANMSRDGYDLESIVKVLDKIRENQELVFTVGDLEHLYKGGRLSRVSRLVGNVLSISPIMYQDTSKGTIELIDTARGTKNTFKRLKQELRDQAGTIKDQDIHLLLGDWPEMEKQSIEFLVNEIGIKKECIKISTVSGVIAAHTGPEAMGVMIYKDPEPYPYIEYR